MVNCKACDKDFENEKQLHAHLKSHSMRMAEYYQTYYPRHDLYDKKIIKFKTKHQYLNSDFNTRTNLKKWLESQPENDARDYCSDILIKRKGEKELTYSPCQVELRTLMFPPVQFYEKLFGDYHKYCETLGFENKHSNVVDITTGKEWQKPEYTIFVDTREQKPLKFPNRSIEIKKLDYGDYAFSSSEATCNCYIERKSISDFIGTMSGGYERFNNEIKRAMENNAYLVILIEETLSKAMSFPFLPHVSNKIRATPEFIFHRARELIQKYPSIQFLFVGGRKESSRVIEKIFTSGCIHERADLQLAYDLKRL
jgi:hypothetical protein